MIWASRLAGFLLFRVLKTGSDTRFDEMRSKFWSFAGFWVGQVSGTGYMCEAGCVLILLFDVGYGWR